MISSKVSFWMPNKISSSLSGNQNSNILFHIFPKMFPEHCNICTIHKIVNQCITMLMTILTYICNVSIPDRQRVIRPTWEKSIYYLVLKCLQVCFTANSIGQSKDVYPFIFFYIINFCPLLSGCSFLILLINDL